jgi:hypothetical protein
MAPETLAILQSASSLVSPDIARVPAGGLCMTKMVARKSVVSGRREDPVVLADSDSSEGTEDYGERKHANPSDDTEE